MNKLIKLISLIIISLSVYFIYYKTYNSYYQITTIGDRLSQGNNTKNKDNNYIEYYKEYLKQEKNKVIIDSAYTKKNQTIESYLQLLKNSPKAKRKLIDSNIVIITLGYNDLIYNLSIEEEKNNNTLKSIIKKIKKDYNELIDEINKYYHKDIIVVGYNKNYNDSYINKGIIELNKVLKDNKKVCFIDTYNLLINRYKYYSNSNSFYPNDNGYYEITKKIISKTLEIS